MSVNAMIARGFNPGAGKLQAQQTQYGMDRDNEIRSRNAFVQDRSFNAQQEHRSAMQSQGQEQAEAEHERWIMGQIQSAQSPEQARAIYEWGIQDAQKRGFDVSQAPSWEQIAGTYVQPKPQDKYGNTVFEGQDAEGNRIFAQPGGPDGFRPLEGITPPGPSPKEIADERAATARADAAELATVEKQQKADAAKATKVEVEQAARDLLEPGIIDSVKAVYGAYQGALPSMREDTIDAEAKVDRLIDMLTLENTSKMTGVLSESDIKILQRAGTILANKRISDKAAIDEIKRIGKIFDKIGGGNQVGRFTIEEVD